MPLKPSHIAQFYRLLRARGETARTLAAKLGLQQHTYISRLIYGHGRKRGTGSAWPKLRALLTPEELALIAPEERLAYPSLRDAINALPSAPVRQPQKRPCRAKTETLPPVPRSVPQSRHATNPAAAAFIQWRQQKSA